MTDFLQGGGLEKWLSEIGASNSPRSRAGLTTALRFFHAQMPLLERPKRRSFLRAMDLSKPVTVTILAPPTIVAAFRKPDEDPLKLFYTKPGTSVLLLGVNPDSRAFARFRVRHPVPVLESTTSGFRIEQDPNARDEGRYSPPEYIASGGRVQYVIPNAWRHLDVL